MAIFTKKISALPAASAINDADTTELSQSGVSKKSAWSLIKSTLKTYFDTLYNNFTLANGSGTTANGNKVDWRGTLDQETIVETDTQTLFIGKTSTNKGFILTDADQYIGILGGSEGGQAIYINDDDDSIIVLDGRADGAARGLEIDLGGITGAGYVDGTLPHRLYNDGRYAPISVSLLYQRSLFDHYSDVGNAGTSETDLYSDTIVAGLLDANGDKIEAEYGGSFVSSGTATRQVKIYFGGTVIFDSGALTLSLSSAWTVYCLIIRVSDTVIRYEVSFTTQGAALSAYTSCGEVTGLTLSATNILKITGQASGIGAATNDIIAKLGTVTFKPHA